MKHADGSSTNNTGVVRFLQKKRTERTNQIDKYTLSTDAQREKLVLVCYRGLVKMINVATGPRVLYQLHRNTITNVVSYSIVVSSLFLCLAFPTSCFPSFTVILLSAPSFLSSSLLAIPIRIRVLSYLLHARQPVQLNSACDIVRVNDKQQRGTDRCSEARQRGKGAKREGPEQG